MNFIALSLVSLKGVIALGSWQGQDPRVLFCEEWSAGDNTGLSGDVVAAWERLKLQAGGAQLSSVNEIYVVAGPGSFTGIRVGAAFATGLATGLGIPAYSLSSYDLFDEPVGIPVRTHLAVQTPAAGCAAANIEFIFAGAQNTRLARLPQPGDFLLGVQDVAEEFKNWPTREQLQRALIKGAPLRRPLAPDYGLSPKIFGKR